MIEVAKFLNEYEAVAYLDRYPRKNLLIILEWGYHVVYDAR